tara:strand:+ start:227 stop:550 length:324 start_codon:yes stop_codon:yes gene_type:complete
MRWRPLLAITALVLLWQVFDLKQIWFAIILLLVSVKWAKSRCPKCGEDLPSFQRGEANEKPKCLNCGEELPTMKPWLSKLLLILVVGTLALVFFLDGCFLFPRSEGS